MIFGKNQRQEFNSIMGDLATDRANMIKMHDDVEGSSSVLAQMREHSAALLTLIGDLQTLIDHSRNMSVSDS
jgi:hypothetical protein